MFISAVKKQLRNVIRKFASLVALCISNCSAHLYTVVRLRNFPSRSEFLSMNYASFGTNKAHLFAVEDFRLQIDL
jgi:hypothetical protein